MSMSRGETQTLFGFVFDILTVDPPCSSSSFNNYKTTFFSSELIKSMLPLVLARICQ